MAGMTLRLARSPEAPNRTTVQGSATPPYTEPPAIVSPSAYLSPANLVALLYLNAEFSKLRPQLVRALMMNRVHSELSRTFQVQWAIVDEQALLGRALRDFQCYAKDGLFRLARV